MVVFNIVFILSFFVIKVLADSRELESVNCKNSVVCGNNEFCCGRFLDKCCLIESDVRYIILPFIAIFLVVFVWIVFCCKCKSNDDLLINTPKGRVTVSYDDLRKEALKAKAAKGRTSVPNLPMYWENQPQDYGSIKKETQYNSAPS